MENSKSIFIKIDEFIFQKLDLLKAEGLFQKGQDLISNLDENQQKIAAQLAAFTFILLPYVVVLGFWWGNHFTRKSLEVKKQIIEQIALYDGNKTALNNVAGNYLSPTPINGQEDMDNRVRNIAAGGGIDQQKVSVVQFNQVGQSSSVTKIEADVSFRGFGTNDFSSFMRGLVEAERFKISKVSLTKNNETNLLEGVISVLHLGQTPVMNEQSE